MSKLKEYDDKHYWQRSWNFRQKLYQVGIEPNIINTYVPIYEEEQSFEAVIEVAKNYEN